MRKLNRGPNKRACRIRLKKGDKVVVTAGAHKGKGPAAITQVMPEKGAVVIEGVNVRKKHLRRSQENPQGGTQDVEMPIAVSNVLLYSSKLKRGVRFKIEEKDGKKVRVGVPCGTVFD